MIRFAAIFFFCAWPLFGQSNSGELRLKVTDPSGLSVRTTVQIVSQANDYRNDLTTTDQGVLNVQRLPYGIYQLEIRQPGFADMTASVDIHSTIPTEYTIRLKLPSVNESVTVTAPNTLIDPDQAGSVSQIGTDLIENRLSSIPGRSIQDLVNSQPGWLYEGNAVLHPRGSEYQTQFVVDGVPLTDNRSPSFGPAIDGDDVQSLSIYTAGIPAEYGRKMGGVVEVNTLQDSQPGFHGQLVLSGGSFDSAGAAAAWQYAWGTNTFGGQRQWQHDGPLSQSRGSAKLYKQRNIGRFFHQLRTRPHLKRSLAIHRSPRNLALRASERTVAAGQRPAPNRR